MSDRSPFAPFRLDETGEADPSHCLRLADGDMEQVAEVFEEHGAESHGHGWERLAESLVRHLLPADAGRLHFGSEAGTFVVLNSDVETLTELAVVLHSAFHDRELLSRCILAAALAGKQPVASRATAGGP